MEDTKSTPTADSMRADAQQTTQAQDARTPDRKRKSKSTTSSAVKNAYNNRSYDRVEIRIPKGQREQLQAAAAAAGQSTSAYIINAINAAAGREIITPLATNPYI